MSQPLDGTFCAETDLTLIRAFSHRVKVACDELHDDPFDAQARAALIDLISCHSAVADAAFARFLASQDR